MQQGEVSLEDGCSHRDAESSQEEVWEGEGAGGRRGLSLELEAKVLDLLISDLPPGRESEGEGLDATSRDEVDSLSQGQENETGSALLVPSLALTPRCRPSKSSCCAETLASIRMHISGALDCRRMQRGLKQVVRVTPAWLIVNVTKL